MGPNGKDAKVHIGNYLTNSWIEITTALHHSFQRVVAIQLGRQSLRQTRLQHA
jgi:hypothetical protein